MTVRFDDKMTYLPISLGLRNNFYYCNGLNFQVLQQQTEAVGRLGNVLKRDIRDMEIIMAEDTQMADV